MQVGDLKGALGSSERVPPSEKNRELERLIYQLYSKIALELFYRADRRLDTLAKDRREISSFLSELLKGPSSVVDQVVSYFFMERYSLPIRLAVYSFNGNETLKCLNSISSKFPEIESIENMVQKLPLYNFKQVVSRYPHLARLRINWMDLSSLSGQIRGFPSHLSSVSLVSVRVYNEGLSAILDYCSKLNKLEVIDCPDLNFEGVCLKRPSPLKKLYIIASDLSDRGLLKLSILFLKLERLILESNYALTEKAQIAQDSFQELNSVHLGMMPLNDRLVSGLASLPLISRFSLACWKEDAISYEHLAFPEELKELRLSGAHITREQLQRIFDHCKNLLQLTLQNCSNLTGKDISEFSYPASLESIELKNIFITLEEVNLLFLRRQKIQTFSFSGCPNLPKAILKDPLTEDHLNTILEKIWKSPHFKRGASSSSASEITELDEPIFEMDE